jgi:2-amino-4-hydroxy-6-hydroxymethyldihydropteridine diphosphokinase
VSRVAVLALGSNLGDRAAVLQGAVDALLESPAVTGVVVSPVYETAPVGGPDQPEYLNAVLLLDTELSAAALLDRAHAIEQAFGRVRRERYGARTLDVDLIAVGDETSSDPSITLPHPRAHERAFVLAPLADVAPDLVLPGRGTVAKLLATLPGTVDDAAAVRKRDDISLRLPV